MMSASDTRSIAQEIKLSWLKRNSLYYFLKREEERIEKLKWKQPYIKVSIWLLMLATMLLMVSFCLREDSDVLLVWLSNALMSLGTGVFAGWTLYVLTNIRMKSEADIDQRLADIEVLYNLGKNVYDINFSYITYYAMPVEMRSEWNHNQKFANAFLSAYKFVENMPKLGNRQILRTKFDFDYDDVKEKLEKMSTEITYELSYKDVRKYLKEVIRLIGNSYSLIEAYKKDCEAEKTIIKKVPF